MPLKSQSMSYVLAVLLTVASLTTLRAQSSADTSKAQQTLDRAAEEGKYTFLMFYRQNDSATRAMAAVLKESMAGGADQAVVAYVQVGNPADQALVAKHDVSRAPMPITLAIAPNGAMTGIFPQRLTADNIAAAFVTPTMMRVMKSLQAGKLVLVDVQGSTTSPPPAALADFQTDPHFKDRFVTTSMRAADPQETRFIRQMELEPNSSTATTVLIAPPGVVVGKFDRNASKDQIAAALAKAGKCCDDPNCRHGR